MCLGAAAGRGREMRLEVGSMFQGITLRGRNIVGRATRSHWLLGVVLGAWVAMASSAQAYDLSRAYESAAPEAERGFVVGSLGLWIPGVGSFHDFHQLSLEYAGEFGIRVLSIRGEHNLYVVG